MIAKSTTWRPMLWAGIALILMAPLVAMRVSPEVSWTAHDFLAAAALLGGGALAFEIALRLTRRTGVRTAAGVMLGFAVLAMWADGAVGVF